MESNFILKNGVIKDAKEAEMQLHFKFKFLDIFESKNKGSKIFRKILYYDNHSPPIYNKTLGNILGVKLYEGDVLEAYKSFQNKYLP